MVSRDRGTISASPPTADPARIDAIRSGQHGRRQPPTPPQPNRWQEKKSERSYPSAAHDPMPAKPQPVKLLPGQMVADDKLYMVCRKSSWRSLIRFQRPREALASHHVLARQLPKTNLQYRPSRNHPTPLLRQESEVRKNSQGGSRQASGPAAGTTYT